MKKPTDTAIIESLLRVYEKPDDESLLISRPVLFNEGSLSNPVDGVENTLSIRQRIFVF